MQTNELEKGIIKLLQGDLPLKPHPYEDIARQYSVSEEEIVKTIKQMYERKQIRRFGAVLYHRQVGYKYNAMVAWRIPETEADRIGETMASYHEISHCYLRETPADFPYSLFTMIHCRSREHLDEVLRDIVKQTGIGSHIVLKSLRELKKVSMEYV